MDDEKMILEGYEDLEEGEILEDGEILEEIEIVDRRSQTHGKWSAQPGVFDASFYDSSSQTIDLVVDPNSLDSRVSVEL
ncbi:unnamed protein product [Fusarium fujikuroi]|uniref:Uncharacterized protein n=1 Tax=Fusarium fujikuroi TaxID=5127 RepID=A0A9Q9U5D0_FUSFU|nr:unnamed protein product [Fusarium fujikuroi]VTT58798.1 unnamed protein product [Fusarium fujikuroi]VZI10170.1 unnamed protein product [Fusarium fujikuroi]